MTRVATREEMRLAGVTDHRPCEAPFFKAYPGAATKNKSEANGGRFHKEYEPTGHGVREELVLVAAEMQFIALL